MEDGNNNKFNSDKSNISVDIPEMMRRLDKLFDEKDNIIGEAKKHQEAFRKLQIMYEQKQEEIDLMETMIMHMSNKKRRQSEWNKKY